MRSLLTFFKTSPQGFEVNLGEQRERFKQRDDYAFAAASTEVQMNET